MPHPLTFVNIMVSLIQRGERDSHDERKRMRRDRVAWVGQLLLFFHLVFFSSSFVCFLLGYFILRYFIIEKSLEKYKMEFERGRSLGPATERVISRTLIAVICMGSFCFLFFSRWHRTKLEKREEI